jgi:methionine sulfoxide reductase heme-binding subunit
MDKRRRMRLLKWLVHIGAAAPMVWLLISYLTDNLTFNPIQTATLRTGDYALTLLWLSLACSPLYTLTGWREVRDLRRPLGLYAFVYAGIHVLVFVGWDYGFNWPLVLPLFVQNTYLLIGALAFILLLALAVTSFRWWMRLLGLGWKYLHRLVYVAAALVVVHYAMVVDGSILTLQGDVGGPLAYGIVLFLLLVLRLPLFRNWLKRASGRREGRPAQRP